jgi:3-phenylpropionate/trans-cinnamate dioxygenase ferredoxin reductase component
MPHYDYLIVGGGMTADSAVHGIREIDAKGSIGIISNDTDPPYDRPPLTKGLWKDKQIDSIWRKTAAQKADLHLGRTAKAIDVRRKAITDDRGEVYNYGKLLLATGGSPRRLPFGDGIIYFRTLEDYRRLRGLADIRERFAVLGGGFIGSEIAAALAMNHKEVIMLFPGSGICDRMFPADLSNFVTDYYRQKGVEVLTGETVSAVERRGEQFLLRTQAQREILVDRVVAGLGITPNVELAKAAGLQIENGITVDELLRSSNPDIYAAGDVAAFHNPALGKRLRVEHEDNANSMGRTAGRNMAGASEPYHHLPFFYSDLFDLGYEAVGELDSRLEAVAEWKVPYREGVIYYERAGIVRGVLLWNVWGQVDTARALIAKAQPLKAGALEGKPVAISQ